MKLIKLLPIFLLISACSWNAKPIVHYETLQSIQIQNRPRPIEVEELKFVHTTDNNSKYLSLTYEQVKVLLRNLAEVRRYIEQQNSLLDYYESEANEINSEFYSKRTNEK